MKAYFAFVGTALLLLISTVHAQPGAPMKLIQTIPLPQVEGYFDHMAVDVKGQRLFVPGEHQRVIAVIA